MFGICKFVFIVKKAKNYLNQFSKYIQQKFKTNFSKLKVMYSLYGKFIQELKTI